MFTVNVQGSCRRRKRTGRYKKLAGALKAARAASKSCYGNVVLVNRGKYGSPVASCMNGTCSKRVRRRRRSRR